VEAEDPLEERRELESLIGVSFFVDMACSNVGHSEGSDMAGASLLSEGYLSSYKNKIKR
jgi:hypothetical protein